MTVTTGRYKDDGNSLESQLKRYKENNPRSRIRGVNISAVSSPVWGMLYVRSSSDHGVSSEVFTAVPGIGWTVRPSGVGASSLAEV